MSWGKKKGDKVKTSPNISNLSYLKNIDANENLRKKAKNSYGIYKNSFYIKNGEYLRTIFDSADSIQSESRKPSVDSIDDDLESKENGSGSSSPSTPKTKQRYPSKISSPSSHVSPFEVGTESTVKTQDLEEEGFPISEDRSPVTRSNSVVFRDNDSNNNNSTPSSDEGSTYIQKKKKKKKAMNFLTLGKAKRLRSFDWGTFFKGKPREVISHTHHNSSEEEEGRKFFARRRSPSDVLTGHLRNSDEGVSTERHSGENFSFNKSSKRGSDQSMMNTPPIPSNLNPNNNNRRKLFRTNSDLQPRQDYRDSTNPPLLPVSRVVSNAARPRRSSSGSSTAIPPNIISHPIPLNNSPPIPSSLVSSSPTKKDEQQQQQLVETNGSKPSLVVAPIPLPSTSPSDFRRARKSNSFDSLDVSYPKSSTGNERHRSGSYDGDLVRRFAQLQERQRTGSTGTDESSIDSEDDQEANASPQTLSKVQSFTHYIEEYYLDLLTYINLRKDRQTKFEESLNSTQKFTREILIREHIKKENTILRTRRLCGGLTDFKVLKLIGKGAFGQVFLARKIKTSELVALKKISKANTKMKKKQISHVKTEQDVLSDASSSWLVQLLYSFQDSAFIYFAMEFIPGGDFRHFLGEIQKLGDLSESEVCLYAAEMFLAVDALHQLGYIHRDLKPDNFLIDKDGHLKLADFGLSKKGVAASYHEPFTGQLPTIGYSSAVLNSKTYVEKKREKYLQQRKQAFSLVGSPDYMAVELLRKSGIDFSADLWSVGCMIYEMIVGFPPFNAETPHEVFQNVLIYQQVLENPAFENGESCILPDPWNLIKKLICEPQDRIGRDSIDQVKKHKFFKNIDWDNLKSTPAPYPPKLSSEIDTSYFPNAQNVPEDMMENASVPFQQMMENIAERSEDYSSIPFSQYLYKKSKADNERSEKKGKRALVRSTSGLERFGRLFSRSNSLKIERNFDPTSLTQLSLRDWKVLCTGAQRIVLQKDTVIIQEGERNSFLYRIRSGLVRIEKTTLKGKVLLGKLQKNQVFGEMSFIEDSNDEEGSGNVSASVIVDSAQTELYKIDKHFIFSIFISDKELFGRFYKIIACMLAERVVNLPFRKEMEKVKQLPNQKIEEQIILDVNRLSKRDPDKDRSRKDGEFCRRFKLTIPEVLIQTLKYCTLHIKKRKYNGKLYIGEKHIGFYSKIFEYRHKEVIAIKDIKDITRDSEKKIHIFVKGKEFIFSFFSPDDKKEDVMVILLNLWNAQGGKEPSSPTSNNNNFESKPLRERTGSTTAARLQRRSSTDLCGIFDDEQLNQDLTLTQDDWGMILQGGEFNTYMKDEVILGDADESAAIYQIGRGSCRVERMELGKKQVVGIMQQSEMFGEISFLNGTGATSSIVANENHVDIYKIDKEYIFKIFEKNPSIAGKFYKFLCWVLARRIRQRESELLETLEREQEAPEENVIQSDQQQQTQSPQSTNFSSSTTS